MVALPAGFQPHFRKSPVTDPWEPLYSRPREGGIDLAFEVGAAHCNTRGLLHGGVLAALFDNMMGLSLALGVGAERAGLVTISLAVDYLGGAKLGDLVIIVPRVVHAGRTLGTCDALAHVGERSVGRANATFSIRRDEGH